MAEDVPLSLKDYIDASIAEVRRAVEIAKAVPPPESVPLREHIEGIIREGQRAIVVAEQEREKAAKALRAELARAIAEGDNNLREHIAQQIMQIRSALISADLLEVARIDAVAERVAMLNKAGHESIAARIDAVESEAMQHVEQLRRERELVTAGQQEAIAKAEASTEKRFEAVNEFRAQLADQSSSFMPREVAEAQFSELRKQANTNTDRLNQMAGMDVGQRNARAGITQGTQIAIAALGLLVAVLSIAVVVILANAGQ